MIRQVLSQPSGTIDYNNLTYGDILSTINKEGLKMCIKMKINNQINKDRKKVKYEMGNIYEQYDLPPIAPSRHKHQKDKSSFKNSRRFHKKPYMQFHQETSQPKFFEKCSRHKSKSRFVKKDKSKVRCYKCKKIRTLLSECRVKEKISQLDILDSEKN